MQKQSLSNQAMREIISMIADGSYGVGERLPAERALCEHLGISRGTLRKALEGLEKLGVVSIRANSGVYVNSLADAKLTQRFLPPEFDSVRLEDIIRVRKAIEIPACCLACERIDDRSLDNLEDLVGQMEEAIEDDLASFLKHDMLFHQAIVNASQNPVLARAFEAIYEYHRFSSVFTSQRQGEERIASDYHTHLVAALRKRDASLCQRIMSEHLDHMQKYNSPAKGRTNNRKKKERA